MEFAAAYALKRLRRPQLEEDAIGYIAAIGATRIGLAVGASVVLAAAYAKEAAAALPDNLLARLQKVCGVP